MVRTFSTPCCSAASSHAATMSLSRAIESSSPSSGDSDSNPTRLTYATVTSANDWRASALPSRTWAAPDAGRRLTRSRSFSSTWRSSSARLVRRLATISLNASPSSRYSSVATTSTLTSSAPWLTCLAARTSALMGRVRTLASSSAMSVASSERPTPQVSTRLA